MLKKVFRMQIGSTTSFLTLKQPWDSYDDFSPTISHRWDNVKIKSEIIVIRLAMSANYIWLLCTKRQSSPFHVFHWSKAYHVRVTKLDCLPRISAIGRQCVFHRWIVEEITCIITWERDLWTEFAFMYIHMYSSLYFFISLTLGIIRIIK